MELSDVNYDPKDDYDEHESHKRSIKKWTDEEVSLKISMLSFYSTLLTEMF